MIFGPGFAIIGGLLVASFSWILLCSPRMTHHFFIDPRSILGVGLEASMEEIQSAFRDKSKKHHPDLGGDEWAFRMVVRAYEILKTTRGIEERHASPTGGPTSASTSAFEDHFQASGFSPTAVEFRTIEVELVWIRFELAGDLKERLHEEPVATTLSVCMVISWPRTSLVKHAAKFPDAAEKLRLVIETFEDLRSQEQVLGSRSRIEDGQFVGWLSYPNVLQAEAGFQILQETLSAHDLRVNLRTRDELFPIEWTDR